MYIERKKSSTLEELRKKNKPQKKIKQKQIKYQKLYPRKKQQKL